MSPSDVPDTTEPDPLACAALALGWRVEELFSQFAIPEQPPRAYDPDRLPGLSKLNSYDWQRLGLDQVDFVMCQTTAKVGSPKAVPLDVTGDAREKLDATIQAGAGQAERRLAYKAAIGQLHIDLLVTLTAADANYGKAYGLGRALADTSRPHQSPSDLAETFERHRVNQLYVWLDELASVLPDHAARSVGRSLGWWSEVATASGGGSPLSAASAPTNPFVVNSIAKQVWWKHTARVLWPFGEQIREKVVAPPDQPTLAAAVVRQGVLWRQILAGEKLGSDLLTPGDYLHAGERLAKHYANLFRQAQGTLIPILALLLVLLAAVVLTLVLIPGSAVARTATAAAAGAGTLSASWRVVRARAAPIVARLEAPLWGAELNTAVAEAITIPPVGAPQDPEWEVAFEQVVSAAVMAEENMGSDTHS